MRLDELNCVILCGGKSSRMGQDKSKLKIKNETLIEFQVRKMSQWFKNVYVSTKEDKFDQKFTIIKDVSEFQIYSPMLALYSILSFFKNEFVFILSVDSPNISENEILKMFAFINENYKIVVAQTPSYKHPLCGFYHSSLANTCKEFFKKNEQKIGFLFSKVKTKFVKFENENAFLNLNFYEEYEKFKRELK
ncbi:molybdenum cofactor guanylyltransferase [Campylobacter estrildidarum]|uniref:Probable molybdenum cofactor guanylyltransferase n=1 Tax=Campylobacter estrildidarum TaxID=2510189 RepID=A0A4U7BPF0_9BACT|nr:molybdenum cofactor guanylyltransferase [Campylobacter estrildidarum]TKX30554.1 molybdenum cofactor guanylyltransferase [Campylobacter estrildidarum]